MRTRTRVIRLSQIEVNPRTQRSLDMKWVEKIANRFDPALFGIPVVQPNGKPNRFYVLDGQHRLKALELVSSDDPRVEVEVLEDDAERTGAHVFVGRNTAKTVPAIEKFLVRLTEEDPIVVGVVSICKSHGLKIGNIPSEGYVGAVVALESVFNMDDTGALLDQTLRVLIGSFGNKSTSFQFVLIKGVAGFLKKFPDADPGRVSAVLSKTPGGANGLIGKGQTARELSGGSVSSAVSLAILALYNSKLRDKLG